MTTETTLGGARDFYKETADLIAKKRRRERLKKLWAVIDASLATFLVPFYMLWQGVVLSILWMWFVEPLGVHSLPPFYAVGIVMIFRYAFPTNLAFQGTKFDPKKSMLLQSFTTYFVMPATLLSVAWAWRWLGWGY